MDRPSNCPPRIPPRAPVDALNFRIHRSGRAVDTSPERRQSKTFNPASSLANDEGRFDIPDVFMPPVTPPRSELKSPASGRRVSSYSTYIPSSDDDSDEDADIKMEDVGVPLKLEPDAESPRRSLRLQQRLPEFPSSEFPARGRTLLRGSWPVTDPHSSSSGGSGDQDEYQKLEELVQNGYFLRGRASLGGFPGSGLRTKPVSQKTVQQKLREERRLRRTRAPSQGILKKSKSIEQAIRDVRHQLTCPPRDISPLTDCDDLDRSVSWPPNDSLDNSLVFCSQIEDGWVDRGLTPSDWSRLG